MTSEIKNQKEHPETGSHVSVKINGTEVSIHRGNTSVAEIKKAGEVPLADDLEIIEEGSKLHLLLDDDSIVIKGGENFVSHPKSSQSS